MPRPSPNRPPEWQSWTAMITRCENPNTKSYYLYGERGISVCSRWRESFRNFLDDMGPRPGEGYSLDRLDNNLGYSPDNCRWATRLEQGRNRRNALRVEIDGAVRTLAHWAETTGIGYSTLYMRHRSGDRGKKLLRKVESCVS